MSHQQILVMCPILEPHPTDRLAILIAELIRTLDKIALIESEMEIVGQDLDYMLRQARSVQTSLIDW